MVDFCDIDEFRLITCLKLERRHGISRGWGECNARYRYVV